MNLGKQVRKAALVFFKLTLNRLTLRLARSSSGPIAIVRHTGRKTGRRYETPIIVSRLPDGFVIELTYGPDVDWHKNLVAAGGGIVLWHGKEYAVGAPEPLDAEAGLATFPPPARLLLRALRRNDFEKLKVRE